MDFIIAYVCMNRKKNVITVLWERTDKGLGVQFTGLMGSTVFLCTSLSTSANAK